MTSDEILDILEGMFPQAHCELLHQDPFQLLVAVVLSAQTTDAAVNQVTPALFAAYPDAFALANANVSDIERYIKRIGLYRSKARNIHALAESLVEQFDGQVPIGMKDLTSLAGVGRKTANVVRSVAFDIPAFAVDTHVARISKRLDLQRCRMMWKRWRASVSVRSKENAGTGRITCLSFLGAIIAQHEIHIVKAVRLPRSVKRKNWKHIESSMLNETLLFGGQYEALDHVRSAIKSDGLIKQGHRFVCNK